ncbi:hypothetical protein [Streptomyces sp. NPDC002588]|uniref:hypothetical protein n=1 Tax=Streptomyces sp. NPDC002588 TaxID=3154419 RepID=UPI0033193B78
MTYNFFTVDHLLSSRISDSLASVLHVAPSAVDVADAEGDQDDRNWEALVLCDRTRVPGDVSLALDVFVQEAVTDRPTEAECAAKFAAAAQTVVLYPAEERIPSAYWLVTPTGLVTRARLMASDDEQPVYSLDAVEAAVPQLPGIRAMQLPEIVREQHVPTPSTAEFTSAVNTLRRNEQDSADSALSDDVGTPLYGARVHLAEWERMVRRMESGWQPTGRYPAELYREALRARDRLSLLTDELAEPVPGLLRKAVDQLDEEFRRHTESDTPSVATAEQGWWWHRKPVLLPWSDN